MNICGHMCKIAQRNPRYEETCDENFTENFTGLKPREITKSIKLYVILM